MLNNGKWEDKISFPKSLFEFHLLHLPKVLNKIEKTAVLLLLLFVILASLFLYKKHYLNTTKPVAVAGGVYIEGILANSRPTLNDSLTSLTHIGLTRLGTDGSIQPALAKSWQISEDGKTYIFHLDNRYYASILADYLRDQKGSWSDIQIATPNKSTIQFTLNQPYGQFLASTLRPVFPYGPFKLKDQSKKDITLIASDSAFHKPYLNKIIFKVYSDKNQLTDALESGKVLSTGEDILTNTKCCSKYSITLPRYNVAFLNTSKPNLADSNIRRQILQGPAFAKPLTLNILRANTNSSSTFTKELTKDWAKRNIKMNEQVVGSATLLTNEAPKKQYDILIYGFNTGYYDDLYPYWHSTQIPPKGMNFSFYKNKQVDRLLEEARLTLDDKVRHDKIAQAKTLIVNDNVAIFQPSAPYEFYVNKSVKGIKIKYATLPTNRFSFCDLWYIKTTRVKK